MKELQAQNASLENRMTVLEQALSSRQQGQPAALRQEQVAVPPSPTWDQQFQQTTPTGQHSGRGGPRQGGPRGACYNCGEMGHYRMNCPHQRCQNQAPTQPYDQARANGSQSTSVQSHLNYLNVKIAGEKNMGLLDTGCEVSIIPARLAGGGDLQPTSQRVCAANGTNIPVSGRATITAKIGSRAVSVSGLVSEHVNELMLGMDWMKEHRVSWEVWRGTATVDGVQYRLCSRPKGCEWIRRVRLTEEVDIPPRTESNLPVGV